MLHQSITARRGNVLRRRTSAGGFSVGGAQASATVAVRVRSEWDQRAGQTSADGMPVSPSCKSRAYAAHENWKWERSPLEEQIARRRFPHVTRQLWTLLQRGVTKYCRALWPLRVIDSMLLLMSAFIIGFIQSTSWGLSAVPNNVVMVMTCLGVLSTVTHLRTFSQDRVLLWRETTSGISIGAFFMSQNIIDLGWVLTSPALMLGPYYYLTLPRLPFSMLYILAMNVCWWTSGMSYLISALVPPQAVLMTGVFVALIFGAFLQGLGPTIASVRGTWIEYLLGLGYNRWAVEIMTINEYEYYQENMRNSIIMIFKGIGLCGMDKLLVVAGEGDSLTPDEAISFLNIQRNFDFSYCHKYISNAHIALVALGLVFRLLAFLLLYFARKGL